MFSDSPAIQKFISGLLKMSSSAMFALNILPSAVKNRQSAIVQLQNEATAGRYINWNSYLRGKGRAVSMMAAYSFQLYKTGNRSMDVQLLQVFDPTQDILKTTFGDARASDMGGQFGRSVAADAASLGFLMSTRKFLEVESVVELFSGMMHHVKVEQTINDETNEIRYIDAFEVVNGQLELKAGIDKEWAPGGAKFKEFKNRVHELSNRLYGAYADMDQPEAQRYVAFRVGSFLKRFFTSMLMNRVGATRGSAALGGVSTGYYRSVLQVAKGFAKYGVKNYYWMSDEQRSNLLKFTSDMAHQMALLFILTAVFGYNDSDPDRFEKMRQRSGALNEEDFNLQGWLFNHGLVATLGTLTETETFGSWSPVTMGADGDLDVAILGRNWKTLKNTAGQMLDPRTLYATTIKRQLELLGHVSQFIDDDPAGFYKKDAGPYWFQKEGSPKFLNDAGGILGFTGSQVDPVKALKGMELGRR
jgi:hypothetical protein